MNHFPMRRISRPDNLLSLIEKAITQPHAPRAELKRVSPAVSVMDYPLSSQEKKDVAGMMRVNHSGEVCAQALYLGQAFVAHNPHTQAHLLSAAAEERDHLDWCAQRLHELDAQPSRFDFLWYAGSFAIGVGAAAISDDISLGFVMETERQVEAHLKEHLQRLPQQDERSRAILTAMQEDEVRHGDNARLSGGVQLPPPIPRLMSIAAHIMKMVAYRI